LLHRHRTDVLVRLFDIVFDADQRRSGRRSAFRLDGRDRRLVRRIFVVRNPRLCFFETAIGLLLGVVVSWIITWYELSLFRAGDRSGCVVDPLSRDRSIDHRQFSALWIATPTCRCAAWAPQLADALRYEDEDRRVSRRLTFQKWVAAHH